MYVLGLDVGSQDVTALICDDGGNVLACAVEGLPSPESREELPQGLDEQNPVDWWVAASACIRAAVRKLRESGLSPGDIAAVAVDSASGTVVPLDAGGTPLRSAIMRDDIRADAESQECNVSGNELADKFGCQFTSSFVLPKILWIKRNEPRIFERTKYFANAVDYMVGRLTGNFHISDSSNASMAGYDLLGRRWPGFIESDLGIPSDTLPLVVNPGDKIGEVSAACSEDTGLFAGTPVVAGISGRAAAFLASGAVKPGDWNSAIGSTMAVCGVSTNLLKDPWGRIHCYAHPQGYWIHGGASNVGVECLAKLFHRRSFDELNAYVPQYSPTSLLVYPLVRVGERLPFANAHVQGFIVGEPRDSRDLYTAYLEGIGFVERWCIELLEGLGAEVGDTIYTTGVGSKNSEWMQVRANIMNRRVVRPVHDECAMGTAVLAASTTLFPNLQSAAQSMIKFEESAYPDASKAESYSEYYAAFREACARRGYE